MYRSFFKIKYLMKIKALYLNNQIISSNNNQLIVKLNFTIHYSKAIKKLMKKNKKNNKINEILNF